jgi:hypothetical protein
MRETLHNAGAMVSLGYKRSRFFCDLFIHEKERLEAVLARYEVPPVVASRLLAEVVLELIYKGETVDTPGDWMVSKIRNQCRRFWVDRRRSLWATLDEAFPGDSVH